MELLLEWHQGEPHKWPLTVIMEVWEELHWRFFEGGGPGDDVVARLEVSCVAAQLERYCMAGAPEDL